MGPTMALEVRENPSSCLSSLASINQVRQVARNIFIAFDVQNQKTKAMGITIHFEGRLKNVSSLDAVLALTRRFCDEHSWPYEPINESRATLKRVRNEKDWDYVGPTKGITVQPHESSEPFRLEFDRDLYLQEYTKTQFAPIEVHMELVSLLRELAPHFANLDVCDEGEFYETNNLVTLEGHFNRCFELLDEYLLQQDKYYGPIRLESKRIVDVVSRE